MSTTERQNFNQPSVRVIELQKQFIDDVLPIVKESIEKIEEPKKQTIEVDTEDILSIFSSFASQY